MGLLNSDANLNWAVSGAIRVAKERNTTPPVSSAGYMVENSLLNLLIPYTI